MYPGCGKRFFRQSELKQHFQIHTEMQSGLQTITGVPNVPLHDGNENDATTAPNPNTGTNDHPSSATASVPDGTHAMHASVHPHASTNPSSHDAHDMKNSPLKQNTNV